ncbi:hypothetical protein EB796_011489 [Bugula neritina]|uniref:Uncharacterized protein n=1 Tax=Bugula neritina TaxID=10212 RepID=A0A7J7JY22_BUGNE|nr:hypothetical protein EB796_011489 [Bugula neritina]
MRCHLLACGFSLPDWIEQPMMWRLLPNGQSSAHFIPSMSQMSNPLFQIRLAQGLLVIGVSPVGGVVPATRLLVYHGILHAKPLLLY